MARLICALAASLALAAFLLSAPVVWAHASLVAAEPPPGITVTGSPAELRLTFSEPLAPGSTVSLYTAGFQRVDGIQVALDDSTLIAQPQASLAPGTYTVQWTAISGDGHAVEGSYQFAVATAPAPSGGVLAFRLAVAGGLLLALVAGVLIWRGRVRPRPDVL